MFFLKGQLIFKNMVDLQSLKLELVNDVYIHIPPPLLFVILTHFKDHFFFRKNYMPSLYPSLTNFCFQDLTDNVFFKILNDYIIK